MKQIVMDIIRPPTKVFWYCNLLGWTTYCIIISWFMRYHNQDSFSQHLLHNLSLALLLNVGALAFRRLYHRYFFLRQDPIRILPILFLFAAAAAYISTVTLIYFYTLDAPNPPLTIWHPMRDIHWGSIWLGTFNAALYAMSIWLILYVMIAQEKSNEPHHTSLHSSRPLVAVATLFVFYSCVYLLGRWVWTWGTLQDYCAIKVIHFTVALLLSTTVLLLKPHYSLAKSTLIPLLPLLIFLSLCNTVLVTLVTAATNFFYYFITYHEEENIFLAFQKIQSGDDKVFINGSAFLGGLTEDFQWQIIFCLVLLGCHTLSRKNHDKTITTPWDIKHALLFLAYNTCGWALISLFSYFINVYNLDLIDKSLSQVAVFINMLTGAVLSVILRFFIKHYRFSHVSPAIFIPRILGISIFLGAVAASVVTLLNLLYAYGFLSNEHVLRYQTFITTSHYVYSALIWFSLSFFIWSLLYLQITLQRKKQDDEMKSLQLEKSMKEAQLSALSSKVDPHFIFNALNNIRYLVKKDGDKARDAILVLSEILRSPISLAQHEKILMAQELEVVRHYITLCKIQYEDLLTYKEDIPTRVLSALIPPMTLQLLVENAIKYGVGQLEDGGCVSVSINTTETLLTCRVINSGQLHSQKSISGFGMGIQNIKERLRILYNNAGSFDLYEQNNRVVAELTIPLEYPE